VCPPCPAARRQSLDQQLYTERWAPSTAQVLQLALGVARGMDYLHTALEREGHQQPLIHRDLKSPNLLLATPPPLNGDAGTPEELQVKIADFGLSKDKSFDHAKHTAVRRHSHSLYSHAVRRSVSVAAADAGAADTHR
jgi:serine/threonine protein kinase